MSTSRQFGGGGGGGTTLGLTGPVPRDLIVLLATVFVTFSLQFFAVTAVIPALARLTPAVWQRGFLWQLLTYPFVGVGQPGIWFVLELLILFLFGREMFQRLGRRNFWNLLVWVGTIAAVVAVVVQLVAAAAGTLPSTAFALMQGQRMLLAILIAAFATVYGRATILLFFVLPIQARWFLGLEIVFAFLGFLSTRDLAGFLGLCAAVGATYLFLSPGPARGNLRELWLRTQERWFRFRLDRARRRRGLRVVRGERSRDKGKSGGGDPWVH